jgi:hypothetical protein
MNASCTNRQLIKVARVAIGRSVQLSLAVSAERICPAMNRTGIVGGLIQSEDGAMFDPPSTLRNR